MSDLPTYRRGSRGESEDQDETPEPELRVRRSASAEGLSAIQAALRLDEPATSRPVERPTRPAPPPPAAQPQRQVRQPRQQASPARLPRRSPDDPIRRSDYRAPVQKAERHFLALTVAIVCVIAALVALGLAYWALRR